MTARTAWRARRCGRGRRRARWVSAGAACVASGVLLVTPASAQSAAGEDYEPARGSRWFPASRPFAPLLADPAEPRYAAGLIRTNLFEDTGSPAERPGFTVEDDSPADAASDLQGDVAVGTVLPVYQLATWQDGGITVGALIAVFARFRMERSSRDAVGDDWYVGVPVEMADGPLAARLRFVHRSSHLGDEVQAGGALRTEFSYEALDLLAAYSFNATSRLYAGGAVNLRTNSYILEEWNGQPIRLGFDDRRSLQAGAEAGWRPWADGAAGLIAGVDWKASDRTGWRGQLSAAAGVTGAVRGRSTRFLGRCFSGPSTMGEFFRTDEQYCGIEAAVVF